MRAHQPQRRPRARASAPAGRGSAVSQRQPLRQRRDADRDHHRPGQLRAGARAARHRHGQRAYRQRVANDRNRQRQLREERQAWIGQQALRDAHQLRQCS